MDEDEFNVHTIIGFGKCHHGNDRDTCDVCKTAFLEACKKIKTLAKKKGPIQLCEYRPPTEPLAVFYGKIRDTARLTEGITLAERIAVLDVVRAELVSSFQAQIDAAEE